VRAMIGQFVRRLVKSFSGEAWALRRIRGALAHMPSSQIAHTHFFTRDGKLANLFMQEAGWRALYKTRHYFSSLAMQTKETRRAAGPLSLNDILPPAALTASLIHNYSWRLTRAPEARLANQVFHDRTHNARFIDTEQIREICMDLFSQIPLTENRLGVAVPDVINVFDWLAAKIELQLNQLYQQSAWDERSERDPILHTAEALGVDLPTLASEFGDDVVAKILNAFSLRRGERADRLLFATEIGGLALSEDSPLFVDGDRLYAPDANALWIALYNRLLWASRIGSFNKTRSDYVEERVAQIFRHLFGRANVFRTVWEKKGGPEHDLVILLPDALVVVEVKGAAATPLITTNDKQNIERLREHAGKEQSPFYGVSQAQRLIKFVQRQEMPFALRYGSEWETAEAKTLDPRTIKRYFAITVTLEEYGSLVTDWSLLDVVDTSIGSPWGVNVFHLEQLRWAIERRGWDGFDLLAFLEERIHCHSGMITCDELDFAGYWLMNGNLAPFSNAGMTFTGINWASVFDELWLERRGLGHITFPDLPRPSLVTSYDHDAAMRRFTMLVTSPEARHSHFRGIPRLSRPDGRAKSETHE